MIDQLLGVVAITVFSSLMGTSLVVPEVSAVPGDTDLLQVGGAGYWLLPSFTTDPLGVLREPTAAPHRIDYPATPFGFIDLALRAGEDNVDQAIKDAAADGSDVVVVGHSEGSMVIDHLQADYLTDPNAPAADKVTFVIYGSPERGLLRLLFPDGTFVPGFAVTTQDPIESQYDTVVVTGEYDLAADPPDRPWNLLALANAAVGFVTVHNTYAFVDPSTIPAENTHTITNSHHATFTTQLIPSEHLPLTAPLRVVAPDLADRADEVLRPIIDSAYVRHNADDLYLSQGRLVDPGGQDAKRSPAAVVAPTVQTAAVRNGLDRVKDRARKLSETGAHLTKFTSVKRIVKNLPRREDERPRVQRQADRGK